MLGDAPLENFIRSQRKSKQSDLYKTVEDVTAVPHEERKRRRKKHKNKQRLERTNKGKRKKGVGEFGLRLILNINTRFQEKPRLSYF